MFHVKHEGWADSAAAFDVVIDADQAAQLETYEGLLREKAGPFGMIAKADLPRIRERHILDSLRAATYVDAATTAYDLGSGAGLPGIPVAIASPSLHVTLVEARRKRAAFLELAIEALALPNITVFHGHAEHLREPVDLIMVRAFMSASACWAIVEPLLEPAGRLLYFAGARFDVAAGTPEGAEVALFATPALARSGPLAIMTRQ